MATTAPQPDDDLDSARPQAQRSWISREELLSRFREGQSDSGLQDDLARLVGETTEDLGPIR